MNLQAYEGKNIHGNAKSYKHAYQSTLSVIEYQWHLDYSHFGILIFKILKKKKNLKY